MWKPVEHDYGELLTREDFDVQCDYGSIIPGVDGVESPAKYIDGVLHKYSDIGWPEEDFTHILWYNK